MENNQEQPEELFANLKEHWLYHLMQLITFVFIGIIGAYAFGMVGVQLSELFWNMDGIELADSSTYKTADHLNGFRLIQVFSSIGAFLFPVFFQALTSRENLKDYTGIGEKPSLKLLGFAILAMLLALPIINALGTWLNSLSFPESMKAAEITLRQEQEKVLELQNLLMQGTGIWSFLQNALVIAVVPAIAEELFFRKGALKLLFNLTKNAHVSIFISAFLFALVHNEVFNFLPIFLFGVLLGYFALWSGNIWVPIAAHFANNFIALSLVKIQQAYPQEELLQDDYSYPWLLLLFCFVVLVIVLRWTYQLYKKETE